MANIRKIEGKTGTSYKITVTHGRDQNGKQVRYYMTWEPEPKMTQRQIEKEVQRVAYDFEKKIEEGYTVDNRQTFAEYAAYVLDLKERAGTKHRTLVRYRELLGRINPAIGHLKLAELRPQHLNRFYKALGAEGVRKGGERAIAKADLLSLIKEKGLSQDRFAAAVGIAPATVGVAIRGKAIARATADAIAKGLGKPTGVVFDLQQDSRPLSNKTVIEYHRLISTILAQAEKEMLVPYNAAAKATPPKLERREAQAFQPEVVIQIRGCLEQEPIKWKAITHLLLITGARRGEIAGLRLDHIDWENQQVKIDRALLYTSDCGIYEDTTKTGIARTISLPAETMDLLHEYAAWRSQQRLMCGSRWQESGYLFVKEDGGPMHPDSITDWLGKFSQRHGLPHIHPHAFRHTMASLLYYSGMDSIAISKRLGHAKVSTTTDIYSHLIQKADEEAGERIAAAVLRPTKQA